MDNIKLVKHYPGELAFYNSFSGLIPCKVLSVLSLNLDNNPTKVKIITTAKRAGGWLKGEIIECPTYHVVPRESVFMHCGQFKIRNNYEWKDTQK